MPAKPRISGKLTAEISRHNRFSLGNVQTGLFPGPDHQVTQSTPAQSRSESVIAINPRNELNMVGASKKFFEPKKYHFTLGPVYTFDGGKSWSESRLPMQSTWDVMTDPTVAFDGSGTVFLVGEPNRFGHAEIGEEDLVGLGMVVYRSTDGGVTWSEPIQLTTDTNDDKQWVRCDNNPGSPHRGNVYVAWGARSPLRFARSVDHGVTWTGAGNAAPGTQLATSAFGPDISISADGTVHIFWHYPASGTIEYLRSVDGGASFHRQPSAVSGMSSLTGHLPENYDWPHFEHGQFRVLTLVTSCAVPGDVVVVAWADMREGHSRIYYRRSTDNGLTWKGPQSGQPLLPQVTYGDFECFHPQIACTTATGILGCTFYVFGQWQGQQYRINVQLAGSWDFGKTFPWFVTVTDQPWNPLVNAPSAHGHSEVHFIGDYFGLDAGAEDFAVLWTDTRTGVQELFSDVVATKEVVYPHIPDLVGEILVGITQGGGGLVVVGGKLLKVPPNSPLVRLLQLLAGRDRLETADIGDLEDALEDVRQHPSRQD